MLQVLSQEGVKVITEIVLRNEAEGNGMIKKNNRGRKKIMRGLYYFSPFIRDFQNCQELREVFGNIVGEELIPHGNISSDPQVKHSRVTSKITNFPIMYMIF
jgi:hypothetical protein